MIAVLAGNYQQYQNFIRENDLDTKEYFYISSVEKILGMRKLKYVLYGTYYERKDFDKINLRLQIAELEKLNKIEQRTTANVRYGFLRKILTQISKLTSYIRKRYTQLRGKL